MSTIRLSISPGQSLEQVTEAAGLACVTGTVELTYDTTAVYVASPPTGVYDVNYPSNQRAQKTAEIHQCLRILEQYLLRQSDIPQP